MLKPRGQTGLEAKNLASASKLSGLGLDVLALASRHSGVERKFLASVSKFNVMFALHFRKTSDSSTALDCSVLPLDFYPYVDCFEMTMINVTALKVIILYYFSIWPRP